MSCQQASRFITANNNNNSNINNNCKNLDINSHNHNIIKGNRFTTGVIQQEDPYVFTESVPTTPPILFNVQKTRTRLNEITTATNIGKLQKQEIFLTETDGKITSNSNQLKTQASFSSSTTATANTCIAPISKNNVTQSLTATTTITNNNCKNKKLTNVCVVRPQLQTQPSHFHHYQHQQQQHHQNYANSPHEYEGDLKSISPPPLYTPPTPSLWQTPLLLESTTSTSGNTSAKVTNVTALKPPTTLGCVTPIVQTVGSTTTIINPSLTTTAMAKVAPIIVHTPLAPPPPPYPAQSPNQCLPPSKFHNHTFAQHLQKVECLKKAKNSTEVDTNHCNDNGNSIDSPLKSSSPLTLATATSMKVVDNAAASPVKHSENEDLNEIPVNVIFRMAVVPKMNENSSGNIQFVKPQTEMDTHLPAPPVSPTTTQPLKINVNKKLTIPASKITATKQLITQQQINTSSKPQKQNNATKTTTTATTALNSQQYQMLSEGDDNNANSKLLANSTISTKIITITDESKTFETNLKINNSMHISSKTRKINSFPSTNLNFELPYNWQMGCSTTKGAVAVVKMSQHNIDLDISHLATPARLPYCLQQYWLNSYEFCKSSSALMMKSNKSVMNRSIDREERIAVYKQQLRRQAMQLLSTRSLQKLPLQLAKRRLLCVDRLLRKYQQNEQNKKELPANVKRCCVSGCDAYTLEMASHCQQHIVYNAAQHIFLPCTAKFADNTQCKVPVFDITHDLPLCIEHARKRDAYNRLLHEQRPRKISTNPIGRNETMILTSKTTTINASATRSYPNKQHQKQHHQHILQQLPANFNNNGNKRPTLINQHARKRKMSVGLTASPVGRPQKRIKKTVEKSFSTATAAATTITKHQMTRLTSTSLKRKSSTTSLESIASNSQHSTTSSTSQQTQQYQRQQPQPQQHLYSATPTIANTAKSSLAPPALAPLSSGLVGHGLPQHLFSFGHDSRYHQNPQFQTQHQQQQLHPINVKEKHSFSASAYSSGIATTPTELKDFISQFSLISQKHTQAEAITADVNLLNTNSNSNFTSSGMGSTTSLLTADDFLTQDMLSICENSSASSADTGLGGLSDPELMLGGPEDDIPLGDTHLLEGHDLENVLNSLPEDAFKELFTTVHQDESDEIERAIELADKHLKTLQQTIGSELGDFLDFSDDMLMDNGDLCNGSTANTILDTSALFIEGGTIGSTTAAIANVTQGGGAVIGTDIRGLVQT